MILSHIISFIEYRILARLIKLEDFLAKYYYWTHDTYPDWDPEIHPMTRWIKDVTVHDGLATHHFQLHIRSHRFICEYYRRERFEKIA